MEDAKVAYQLRVLFDKKITAYYQEQFKGTFGKVQADVLNYLYENQRTRAYEITETLNISKQHSSKILTRLEEMNLVESKTDDMDRRARVYFLSGKGKMLMNQYIEESNHNFEELLERLSAKDKEQLIKAMRTMVEILDKL